MASALAEGRNSQKPTGRLHSEAVGCTLTVDRKLKTEIPVNPQFDLAGNFEGEDIAPVMVGQGGYKAGKYLISPKFGNPL